MSAQQMGVFRVPIKLRNYLNRYLPPQQQGEHIECEAVVDSGAAELALPADLVERLNLQELGSVRVHTDPLASRQTMVCTAHPTGDL